MLEREEKRIADLEELGLVYNVIENAYIHPNSSVYVPVWDITCDDDKVFEARLNKIKNHLDNLNKEKESL